MTALLPPVRQRRPQIPKDGAEEEAPSPFLFSFGVLSQYFRALRRKDGGAEALGPSGIG